MSTPRTTRKTSPRWMESRLRRLISKIGDGPNNLPSFYGCDMSPESLARCEKRAEQLHAALEASGFLRYVGATS